MAERPVWRKGAVARDTSPAVIGVKAATERGTRKPGRHYCFMMYERIASAAVGMAAVVMLGASLGSYTVSGFQVREPIDVIGAATAHVRSGHSSEQSVAQVPVQHVCKGCDARLHRDEEWPKTEAIYDDEWARQDGDDADAVRIARADDPSAAYRGHPAEGEADVVVDKDLVMYAGVAVSHLDQ